MPLISSLAPAGSAAPPSGERPMVHTVSISKDEKPVVLGAHLTRGAAMAHADQIAKSNWEKHGPKGDLEIGDYPEHFEAIAKKHGTTAERVVPGDPPDAKPGSSDYHWGIEDDEGNFKPHAGLHKDIEAFEKGRAPYPGLKDAAEHFRDQEMPHLAPAVHSVPLG